MGDGKTEIIRIIRKHALQNALRHSGKASNQAVIGKILAESPELKTKLQDLISQISEVVKNVNQLTIEKQQEEIERNWPELLMVKKEAERHELPPLPHVDKYKYIITRFSPNPDCVLHLGSLRALILSHDYARLYKGKFILRFEDTDPRLKKSALEFYDSIREDLEWLECCWDEEHIQSDRLSLYYEHAQQLLERKGGYICTCLKDEFQRHVLKSHPCQCRNLPIESHLERWQKMIDGSYREGDAVYRVKTDLNHPNPAVRDWPAFRIIDTIKNPHPRVGDRYRVWPLYNFACGIDDHLLGITHVIRGKEHMTNTVRQQYLYRYFHWEYPESLHYGRLKIKGAELSKSKIVQSVMEKKVSGFDDPRLATLKALRRRGITPTCLRRIMLEVGVKPIDATISWENIYALNRKIIDPTANRYFFVNEPIPVKIDNIQELIDVRLPLHPEDPQKGFRVVKINPSDGIFHLLLSRDDLKYISLEKVIRLIELFNIKIHEVEDQRITAEYHSRSIEDAKEENASLLQWVKADENIDVEVLMPDASIQKGKCEVDIGKENVGNVIQFVRVGFARIDAISDYRVDLYFTHQ
ncbi:glutamate--tRNA ligase [[Eubacterium] cellulosolvens]